MHSKCRVQVYGIYMNFFLRKTFLEVGCITLGTIQSSLYEEGSVSLKHADSMKRIIYFSLVLDRSIRWKRWTSKGTFQKKIVLCGL
jgi:hypothetical protein